MIYDHHKWSILLAFFLALSACDDAEESQAEDRQKLPTSATMVTQAFEPHPAWRSMADVAVVESPEKTMVIGQAAKQDFVNGVARVGTDHFVVYGQSGADGWLTTMMPTPKVVTMQQVASAYEGGRASIFKVEESLSNPKNASDNSYIMAGSSWSSTKPARGFLAARSFDDKKLWRTEFQAEGFFLEITGLALLPDGGVLIHEIDFREEGGPIQPHGAFRRFDSQGQQIWVRPDAVGGQEKDPALSIDILGMTSLAKGGAVLLGKQGERTADMPRYKLFGYDDQAKPIWQKALSLEPTIAEQESHLDLLAPTDAGGLIVAGYGLYPSPEGGKLADAWVMSLDAQGQTQWQFLSGDALEHDLVTSLKPFADGSVLVAGRSEGGKNAGGYLWLWKLDSMGQPHWKRRFSRSPMFSHIDGIEVMADGQILLVGSALTGTQNADATLVILQP